jgi:hypothetical protein
VSWTSKHQHDYLHFAVSKTPAVLKAAESLAQKRDSCGAVGYDLERLEAFVGS